ncbi:antA/AntB antirepressor family protein [Riemerella columbina]|uniref:antA/AntB antirepressor family protein n=1 Tax=Riemerella columbina TaxID=103810 RepID=UPI0026700F02|nr:antA/AntB antirepressor family protein [Riemerella columbina]WKS95897.1 antA/AntB antirepressor family protein [Riemerella columbina]
MTKTNFQLLALTKTADGRQAVQCSQLYRGLGLDESNYTHWVKRNILGNRWAIEGEDYIPLTRQMQRVNTSDLNEVMPLEYKPNQYRNRSKARDFVLTLDFAKRLAMMTNTTQGESVRRYFLHCEKVAKQKTELIQTELLAELEAYRSLEAIRLQRRELNRQARKHRERIKQAQSTIKQIEYIQLTFNFEEYGNN